ncbi:flagellar hook-associated 2 domain-containing protein [Clostridium sp. DL-VIII]|uniref:flagellar filament capping protein FliD n=1 Tax=Clostridium sp. DL-VIII TaxID=641107 RepID=UPI00023B063D|nr:flagellar filament capping protein FliD [Clostridium sp. DL-VIII]EHJ01508.1 flagellar hook-associated 2 domain-containing protein [Clostridium sp. DL-VIII]
MSNVFLNSTSNSSSSTSSSGLLRVPGMASGLDTDSIVKSMVSSYQNKIDKANQDEQLLQWKQSAYRDIIKGIKDLQNYFDPLSSKYIMGSNSLNINTITSDNTSVATATAGNSAKAGTYSINVTQLATQAVIQGTTAKDSIISTSNFTSSTINSQTLTDGTNTISLNGLAGPTGADLASQINSKIATSALNGKVSAAYVKDTDGTEYIKFTNLTTGTTIKYNDSSLSTPTTINSGISSSSKLVSDLGFSTGNASFTLSNGSSNYTVSLNVDSNTTMQNLIDQVNSATSGAITMSVDNNTGKISFQSKNYGSASNISITNVNTSSTNVIQKLGINDTATNTASVSGTQGKDAIVAIKEPGQSTYTTTTQSSNNFTVNGVSYSLVSKGNANVTVSANTDNVVTNIKNFITDYNTLISTINTKLTEKKDPAYPPLTDAQKSSMSQDQITAWESKAKVGILRNDDNLSQLMTQLRSVFSAPVYSSYDSSDPSKGKIGLSFGKYGSNAIGIDTSSDVTDGGKLVIADETKLRNAITNNFDDFKKLFTGASSSKLADNASYAGSEKYNEDGLLKRMDTVIRSYVSDPGIGTDGTYSLSGTMNIFVNKQYDFSLTGTASQNTLPDQVYSKTLSISKLKTQMSDAETRYYNQFTQLETALTQLNSQQSSLSSMLGTS